MSHRTKKVCVPKLGLKFPAPLINFIFPPEGKIADVGGGVGQRRGVGDDKMEICVPPENQLIQLVDGTTSQGSRHNAVGQPWSI